MTSPHIEVLGPFLRWAGGKRWLVQNYGQTIFPQTFRVYIEPFFGSGAVFFYLRPKKALLSDTNADLIQTYRALRENPAEVFRLLKRHAGKHSTEYYYEMRTRLTRTPFEEAAKFIYLNRTCWNGLYRVNSKGEFNVPKGTRSSVVFPTDDFTGIAQTLKKASLLALDFEHSINKATTGDLLFVDPPYTVKHNHNGFVRYNEVIFSWRDQERLARSLLEAKRRGVQIVSTNADHASVRNLYSKNFEICSISRRTSLAADSRARGVASELLILANCH